MSIPAKPNMDQFRDEDGRCDYEEFDHAVDQWERHVKTLPEVVAVLPAMRDQMNADWETYHWVVETHEDDDLAAIIAEAGGDLTAALAAAKAHTDLMNEMQSNCY